MAASGFTPISLYNSTTAAAVPLNTNLANGELAINITDGKLYYKDNAGVVQVIATKDAASGSFTNLAYTGTLTGGTGVINIGSGQVYKDASGNVGIGNSSPTIPLVVTGTAAIGDAGLVTTYGALFGISGAPSAQATIGIWNPGIGLSHIGYSALSANLKLYNCYSTGLLSGGAGIDIDAGGNVGIGTSSPTRRLSISGGDIELNGGVLYINSGNAYISSAGADLLLSTNANERMRITSTGGISFGATGTAYGTSGQVLTSAGNAPPTWATLGAVNTQTFAASGTWTKPAGVTQVYVQIWGAGGGGRGGQNSTIGQAVGTDGGCGGGYTAVLYNASDLSATETVTIGTGGTGSAGTSTNNSVGAIGNPGGFSIFKNLYAGGGAGGGNTDLNNFGLVPGGVGGYQIGGFGNAFAGPGGGGGGNASGAGGFAGYAGGTQSAVTGGGGAAGAIASAGGNGSAFQGGGGGGGRLGTGSGAGRGGDGGTISGGGGGGGAFHSSGTATSGAGGNGGNGYAIIYSW